MAKTTGQRPSDIVGVEDRWAAYQFDSAVCLVGSTIENAGQEMQEIDRGKRKQLIPKYTMGQLLDPEFRLPRLPAARDQKRDAIGVLRALARRGQGVKVFKVKE